jgi:hypothetical protein
VKLIVGMNLLTAKSPLAFKRTQCRPAQWQWDRTRWKGILIDKSTRRCGANLQRAAADGYFGNRPLPRHSLQRGGKILRPGWNGCITTAKPVPLHAGQFISAIAIFKLSRFIPACFKLVSSAPDQPAPYRCEE